MDFSSSEIEAIRRERKIGKKVVFTNGCFDILHIGHLQYLKEAKALGDILVVGLNSDQSVRNIKGDKRPIIPDNQRREILLSLRYVDYVIIFNEDTPLKLIKEVKPDILVKGGDWRIEEIIGSDFVASYGGKTLSLSLLAGNSTTAIIDRIVNLYR